MNKISEHISYTEATKSHLAVKKGIDNNPNENQLNNMKLVAENCFEPLRKHFGIPLHITSFFRSKALNKELGGARNSKHLLGQAIDIDGDLSGIDNQVIFEWLKANVEFDQLILENVDEKGKAAWVHVSFDKNNNRKECYIMQKINKTTIYKKVV